MNQPSPLYLIDGHSLTFKAYYAIRGLTSPAGRPTGAVYGFLRMLLKFMDECRPNQLAVVFDTGRPTFRSEIYAEYKANREAAPPDFEEQMSWICRLLAAMRIPIYSAEGFEADDVIATLTDRVRAAGGHAAVLTADKDLLQLVCDGVEVLRPGLDEVRRCDEAAVIEIMGVRPGQVADWLALVGDSSDNIPGVPGIGKKTATELLGRFGTLDELLAHAGELTRPRQREALLTHADQARMARRLASLHREVPVEWDPDCCRLAESVFTPEAVAIMRELGFTALLRERKIEAPAAAPAAGSAATAQLDMFGGGEMAPAPTEATAPPAVAAIATRTEVLREPAALQGWLARAMKAPWLAIDTETTSTDAMLAELVGISLAITPGEAAYIPLAHLEHVAGGPQLELAEVRRLLGPLLAGEGPRLTAHHYKYDWKILRRHGFAPVAPAFDSMIASYLIAPDRMAGHGLKALASELCGVSLTPISELIGSGRRQITMAEVAVEEAAVYAGADADATLRLTACLGERLKADPVLKRLLEELELPLAGVLLEMEMGGFRVDVATLAELRKLTESRLNELSREIWNLAGGPFNIGSPRQVAELLYGRLGLESGRRGKTGFSTAEAELERLADCHPIPKLILDYRGCEKLQSTYIDALPKLVHPRTGRIHTSFNQTIAATGRLTSTDPNLQNIPIRTELGRAIRRAFVADDPGHKVLKADYSQIELRILAHFSRDERLCEAYRKGLDIHRQTAGQVLGLAAEAVSAEQRAQAKVINFGIMYGMSAHGLAQQLKVGRAEAALFIERYFATYPGVRRWIEQLLETARQTGYVETLLGRRRPVPELTARNKMIRQGAERIAVNAPIQGTSADMIKLAMIRLDRELPLAVPGARMVCQVHDELVFSVPTARLEAAGEMIRQTMESALELVVPVVVDIGHGDNWAEC